MPLFHHITVFSLSPGEKAAFLEVGVEFTRTNKTLRGETVMFEIGEDDPRYQRVAALLRSFERKRVRDFSMTVPTLRKFVENMVRRRREHLREDAAMQAKWERGIEVLRECRELTNSGRPEQALGVIDSAIPEAIQGNHRRWVSLLCSLAAAFSHSMGNRRRQIHYEEQALPFANEYGFAAYNLAQLLLSDGQLVRAEHYAAEAYRRCMTASTEADRDLITAILRQWPNLAQGM